MYVCVCVLLHLGGGGWKCGWRWLVEGGMNEGWRDGGMNEWKGMEGRERER